MKKSIVIITLVGLFIVSGILAQNGANRSYRGLGQRIKIERKHPGAKAPFMHNSWSDVLEKRKQLNLSDEQIEKIKQMTYEFRSAQVDRRAVVDKARIELGHLKSDKSAVEEAVMQAIDNLAQAQAEIHKARYRFRTEMRTVFTDKQLEQLKELRQERRAKMRHAEPIFERELEFDNDSGI
jgi:Spy/CpxP family protein refolding chaperone